MFSLSNLTKYIWGNSEGSELAVIPSGQFYVLRKASKRAPRQCIYNEAQLAIRRTDVKYQYQLEVARVYYDEAQRPDDSKLTDDDELDDEQMFLIDKTLQFRESEYDDKPSFVWCDPANKSEGIDEEYEFVIDSELRSAKLSPGQFLVVFGQCVWERTHRKSNKLATNEEIEGIINEMAADASRSHGGDRDNSGVDTLAKQVGGLTVAEDTSTPTLEAPDPPATLANGTEIAKSSGMFFIYDPELQGFVLYDDEVEVSVVATGRFQYHLNVVGYHGNKTEDARAYNVLSQLIEPNMNATFNHEYLSLIWNYFEPEGRKRAFSLSVKYEDGDMFSQMHLALTKAAFETVNCEKWEEVNEAERIYMLRASDDKMDIVEPGEEILERFKGASSDEEDEPEMGDDDLYYEKHPEREYVRQEWPEADEGSEKSGEDDDEDEEDEGDDGDAPDGKGREWKSNYKNSQLAVGYQHDRSFVLRGNQIGVFKHTDDDRLEFDTTINRIDDTNGNEFLPNHMMLHEQDRTMVLMNPDEPNNLYKMDLEYGKVVEEWKVHDIIPTRAIAADTKYAPTTATKTLTGISDQAIYRIDPR
ncbi:Vacuolar import and degradation protein 27, partial [Spiromyces aspiralis]